MCHIILMPNLTAIRPNISQIIQYIVNVAQAVALGVYRSCNYIVSLSWYVRFTFSSKSKHNRFVCL